MKQVTLNIPENKFKFFMELIENLGFIETKAQDIPEEHKKLVRKRIAESKNHPEKLLDWDEVKNSFNVE